jgi:hypothetical protein
MINLPKPHSHIDGVALFTAEQVKKMVVDELVRVADEPGISGNTLAQARVLIAAHKYENDNV